MIRAQVKKGKIPMHHSEQCGLLRQFFASTVFRLLRNTIFASDRLLMAARHSPEIVGAGLVPTQVRVTTRVAPTRAARRAAPTFSIPRYGRLRMTTSLIRANYYLLLPSSVVGS